MENPGIKIMPKPKTTIYEVARRSYKLYLYGNTSKTDTARYTQARFNQYCNSFMGRIFFGSKKISTAGLGSLANQACYKSKAIVRAIKASSKTTGNKLNIPIAKTIGCYATLEKSNTTKFDYWVKVSSQFSNKPVRLPAKSHKALNGALKNGWRLKQLCEFKIINGNAYAIVFLSKETQKILNEKTVIGCDVGYKYSVTTSDGHIGRNLSKVIKRSKQIQSERRRQGHKISSKVKTAVKQILDIEAKRLIGRSDGSALAVESPKRLANLRSGKLHGWARSYFANRLNILGKENGISVIEVNPFQTSITCSKCQAIDKQSRATRDKFKCTQCGFTLHADLNASRNIALKGTQNIRMGNFLPKTVTAY